MIILNLEHQEGRRLVHEGDQLEFDDLSISEWEDLEDLFEGRKMIDLNSYEIEDFAQEVIEDPDEKYIKVKGAQWNLTNGGRENGFDLYVQSWMNESEVSDLRDLMEGGIDSGCTDLIWTETCHEVLIKYIGDIETKVEEYADEFGGIAELVNGIFPNGFHFEVFVKLAFEETVRNALIALELDI